MNTPAKSPVPLPALTIRRVLIVFVVLAAAIIAAGLLYQRNFEAQYRAKAAIQLSVIVETKVSELVNWRRERMVDAMVLFKNAAFVPLARQFLANPTDANTQPLMDWLEKLAQYSRYDRIWLLDAQGDTRLSLPAGQKPSAAETLQRVSEVLKSAKPSFHDFYRNEPDKRVYLALMVPVLDDRDNGRPVGVLVMRIDPEKYLYPFIQRWPTPSRTAETLLVRREGSEVVFLNELRFQTNTALNLHVSLDHLSMPAVQAALGREGVMEGVDYRGVPVLSALRSIPDSPWAMVARMDTAEVYAPLKDQLLKSILLLGLILVALGAGAGMLWYTQNRRNLLARVAAADALSASEVRFRTLFDRANDGIFIMDTNGSLILVNESLARMHGYSVDEMTQMNLKDLDRSNTLEASPDRVARLLAGEHLNFEVEHYHKDGHILPLEVSASMIFVDGQAMMQCFHRDITKRKLAEEQLQEKEERYRTLADSGMALIWTSGTDKKCDYFNQPWLNFTGRTLEQEMGDGWAEGVHPDDLALCFKIYTEAFDRHEPFSMDYRLRRHDGEFRWIQDEGTPPYDRRGNFIGYIGHCLDVTERKLALAEKDKLEAQNRQLQKSESLGRMAGAIAHHFNNQLMAVMGNLELTLDELPKESILFATISAAMQAAKRAAEVSSLMLTYLGKTPVDNISLDLAATCRESLPLLNDGLPENVVLETDLPNPGPTINASSKQIQQVLSILFENAWEAMSVAGGTVRLTVKTVSQADIATASRFPADWKPQAKAYACLKVADTGVGITSQDLANIFDPFFSSKFAGRGLGLAVLAGILKALEGVVTVESVPGLGSTFCVYLPLSSQSQPATAKPSVEIVKLETPPASYAQSGTMLLVEDDEFVRKVAKRMIEHCGFSVLTAGDGAEGLQVFRQHQAEICCVLTDLTMPRMDGWATLAALRVLRPGLPVILASGYAETEIMAGEHPERPQVFLGKPFQMRELRAAIEKAVK